MGKTTYCHKIAYDWAKKRKGGESFPDVTFVLLLKCRDINRIAHFVPAKHFAEVQPVV